MRPLPFVTAQYPSRFTPCEWLERPNDPILTSAKFSSTGGQLYLTWGSSTDRAEFGGSTFSCDDILDFELAAFASCSWTTDATLTATLDDRATCTPGDNVTAREGVLKVCQRARRFQWFDIRNNEHPFSPQAYCPFHDCSCWPTANASQTVLGQPDTALVPAAVFVAAESIGSCSDIKIDATASTGSGGRDWVLADWSVNASLPAANLTELRNYTSKWSANVEPELEVPNKYLFRGQVRVGAFCHLSHRRQRPPDNTVTKKLTLCHAQQTYMFSLTLKNFLQYSATYSYHISVR